MALTKRLQTVNSVRSIKDMEVGETGYTVPWALAFDFQEKPYLNVGMSVYKKPSGTVKLPITCTGAGKKDYEISINSVDYQWDRKGKITETDNTVAL